MSIFSDKIEKYKSDLHKVVDFNPSTDQLLPLDFTANNKELTPEILADTDLFSLWVNEKLASANAKYGIGGYNEHRTIYSRSEHFDTLEEPRRLHLGTDIWGPAKTPGWRRKRRAATTSRLCPLRWRKAGIQGL